VAPTRKIGFGFTSCLTGHSVSATSISSTSPPRWEPKCARGRMPSPALRRTMESQTLRELVKSLHGMRTQGPAFL
jgi:hypothetical protein